MLRPDIKITFVDSTAKKLKFTNSVAQEFSMTDVETCPERAEELVNKGNREKFDVARERVAIIIAYFGGKKNGCRVKIG